MLNNFSSIYGKAKRAVKFWWLQLISGLIMIVLGIVMFSYPLEGYVALSFFFGVAMLVSGMVQIIIALTSRNLFVIKGSSIVGGILDVCLGVLLCFHPAMTMALLPLIFGFWLLYHSFVTIGFGGDLNMLNVKGAPWFIILGIISLILSFIILINPFSFGVAIVVIVTSIAFIIQGIAMVIASFKLKSLKELED